jgi:hypothetical protein
MFHPATREKLKARLALAGPAKAGKTYTGLRIAACLAGPDGKIAVIDTEHRSASKYQGESPDGIPFHFQVCELEHYAPTTFTAAIREASGMGVDVLMIDSLTHEWDGFGGLLEMKNAISSKTGNEFTAWGPVTPKHHELIETMLSLPCHLIVTLRSKMEYVLEESVNSSGRKVMVPKKIGMQPVQKPGCEFEFDVLGALDTEHLLTITGSRCHELDGRQFTKPGPEVAEILRKWLAEGSDPAERRPLVIPAEATVSVTPPERPWDKTASPLPREQAIETAPQPPDAKSNDRTFSVSDRSKCVPAQVAVILGLVDELKIDAVALKQIVLRRGVQSVPDLSVGQAEEVIQKLKEAQSRAQAPF